MKKRTKRAVITLLFLAIAIFYFSSNYSFEVLTGKFVKESNEPIAEQVTNEPVILFCPRDSCAANLVFLINKANKVHCALFDLDLEPVIDALKAKNALVVVDNNNYADNLDFAKQDTKYQLSHNKFCILDDRIVWTGSFNPTYRGSNKNNNNVIVIESRYLASNYEEEFQELWAGQFGKGVRVKNPVIKINNITVESYFCPEDWCANKLIYALHSATSSIYFMTFSFTHDKVGEKIIEKFSEGIEIKGIFEKSQRSQYSEFEKLNASGINVKFDSNPYNMHHKVFIIDNETVITGSFNPTKNADTRNDENLLIIHDKKIAEKYLEEFDYLWGEK